MQSCVNASRASSPEAAPAASTTLQWVVANRSLLNASLANIDANIYEVFVITRLHEFFDIKDDESEALEAF